MQEKNQEDPTHVFLRPLAQQLRDTEIYDPNKVGHNGPFKLDFFVRPISQKMLMSDETKSLVDTNLTRSGSLAAPFEFSLFGYNFFVEESASDEDKAKIVDGGLFSFFYFGDRRFSDMNLIQMPRRSAKMDFWDYAHLMQRFPQEFNIAPSEAPNMTVEQMKKSFYAWRENSNAQCFPSQKHYMPAEVGRSVQKFNSGECFRVEIEWKRAPQVSRPLRLLSCLEGILWSPL